MSKRIRALLTEVRKRSGERKAAAKGSRETLTGRLLQLMERLPAEEQEGESKAASWTRRLAESQTESERAGLIGQLKARASKIRLKNLERFGRLW